MSKTKITSQNQRFLDSNEIVYGIKDEDILKTYSAFIIKPNNNFDSSSQISSQQTYSHLLNLESVLNISTNLQTSLQRIFIPARVKKKNENKNKSTKKQNNLLNDFIGENNDSIEVMITFFLFKTNFEEK